jgi:hypothetical protein
MAYFMKEVALEDEQLLGSVAAGASSDWPMKSSSAMPKASAIMKYAMVRPSDVRVSLFLFMVSSLVIEE